MGGNSAPLNKVNWHCPALKFREIGAPCLDFIHHCLAEQEQKAKGNESSDLSLHSFPVSLEQT